MSIAANARKWPQMQCSRCELVVNRDGDEGKTPRGAASLTEGEGYSAMKGKRFCQAGKQSPTRGEITSTRARRIAIVWKSARRVAGNLCTLRMYA